MYGIGIPVGISTEPLVMSAIYDDFATLEEAEKEAQGINADGWVAIIYELRGGRWYEVSVLAPDIDWDIDWSDTCDGYLVPPPDDWVEDSPF
jgi:hypothetical protein